MVRAATTQSFGGLFKSWRETRRVSQLALAMDAEISQKHLSFIESGRATPSREMILRLAEHLDVPLRERNHLLLAAGYAPLYLEHALDEPALAMARRAVDIVLKGHEPYPALAVDRHWNLVSANAAVTPLIADCAPALLAPPINVVRLSLHPQGLSRRIRNLREWRAHMLERLRRQHRASRDPKIEVLIAEIQAWNGGEDPHVGTGTFDVVMPLQLESGRGLLSLFGTTSVFGTAAEITLSELTIEAFYPADAATAERLAAKD
jgi:transcriptional regulator with XRE-family HTH domain